MILSAGEKRGGVQLLYLMVIMMGEFFWLYKCVSWQLILLASPSHWSLFVLVYWTSVNRQTTKHPNYPLGSGREIHIRWPCFRWWDNIADLLNKEILGNKLSDLWIVQTLCVCVCVWVSGDVKIILFLGIPASWVWLAQCRITLVLISWLLLLLMFIDHLVN